jgi:DNA-binding CsgD family transcriptional regulator
VRAHVRLAGGRAEAALADAQAWTGIAATLGDPILPVEFHAALPLALRGAGDEDAALAAAEAVVARERAWGTAGRTAAALRTLADVAPARATELLPEALALAETAPLPLEQARVLVAHGFALRRAGERTQARAILQRGLQLAATCQAGPLRDRALDELRVLGARPRRLAFDGVESLTRSERRVVDLAAGGATNREIAQQLFVSVKTVDSHLEHAYRKLGISSRKALPALLRGDGA